MAVLKKYPVLTVRNKTGADTLNPDVSGIYYSTTSTYYERGDGAYFIEYNLSEAVYVISDEADASGIKFYKSDEDSTYYIGEYSPYDAGNTGFSGTPIVEFMPQQLSHDGKKLFNEKGL